MLCIAAMFGFCCPPFIVVCHNGLQSWRLRMQHGQRQVEQLHFHYSHRLAARCSFTLRARNGASWMSPSANRCHDRTLAKSKRIDFALENANSRQRLQKRYWKTDWKERQRNHIGLAHIITCQRLPACRLPSAARIAWPKHARPTAAACARGAPTSTRHFRRPSAACTPT